MCCSFWINLKNQIFHTRDVYGLFSAHCFTLPHIGGNTTEAAHRASYFAAMGIQEVYEGKAPTWPINDVDYKTAKTYTDTKKPDTKPAGMFDF